MHKHYLMIILLLLGFNACEKAKSPTISMPIASNKGVFILNQGDFNWGNASLTYYDITKDIVSNDVFQKVNSAPLGDVAQSMIIKDSTGFIVVNNSGKIYIINTHTFKYIAKIVNLVSPRYIQLISNTKAYISDLYSKNIVVFNPTTYTITGSIPIHHSSEQMLLYKNEVFACSWNMDNKIMVINAETDLLQDSITVSLQPNSLVLDKNNKLWVLSDGGYVGMPAKVKATLSRINTQTKLIEATYEFPSSEMAPKSLCINSAKDSIYYINTNIYKMAIADNILPSTPIILSNNNIFYTLAVDPNHPILYVSDAIDYVQSGSVYKYGSSGQLLKSFKAGIIPGGFCFQ